MVDDTPVGAAWVRNLPASDPGYGFVAPGIPELVIAISPHSGGNKSITWVRGRQIADPCGADGGVVNKTDKPYLVGRPAIDVIGNLTSWLRRDGQPPQTYLSWSTS
jgi:hypothetical protein